MSDKHPSCEERVQERLDSRLDDLRLLWAGYTGAECAECRGVKTFGQWEGASFIEKDCPICEGTGITPEDVPALGNLYEYGLSFDYVEVGTFNGQCEGYFRYQLSWGGPSDEFRFYTGFDKVPYRVEYWFMDWFDGAHRQLSGEDRDLLVELFDWFAECGTVEAEYQRAIAA